jgi:hypothetical protein
MSVQRLFDFFGFWNLQLYLMSYQVTSASFQSLFGALFQKLVHHLFQLLLFTESAFYFSDASDYFFGVFLLTDSSPQTTLLISG